MRILIADDDTIQLLFLEDAVAPFADVALARTGAEAVELFTHGLVSGQPFDVLLMDVMMPGMDGLQALEMCRAEEDRQDVPQDRRAHAVVISSLDDSKRMSRAFFGGHADDWLVKPVDPTLLADKVQLLANGRANRM